MSCYIAIPSEGDTKGGKFGRLDHWDLAKECIQISPNGITCKKAIKEAELSGLIVIGLPFLIQDPTVARGLLLRDEIDGIFLHPGRSNTPGANEVDRVIGRLSKDLGEAIRARMVAFTHSGDPDYQVLCLQAVWNWLASPYDGNQKIAALNLQSLPGAYEDLRRKGSRNLLVELCILAQGCVEGQLREEVRNEFIKKLVELLEGDGAWMLQDQVLGRSVMPLKEAASLQVVPKETVEGFLDFVRDHFSAVKNSKTFEV